jgi:hypothetical protein
LSGVPVDNGSGEEPPEERPVTLKRRYVTLERVLNKWLN